MKKYYRALFLGIVDTVLTDGFIVHKLAQKAKNEKVPTHGEFTRRLQEHLLAIQPHDPQSNVEPRDLVPGPTASTEHESIYPDEFYMSKRR